MLEKMDNYYYGDNKQNNDYNSFKFEIRNIIEIYFN